MSKINSLKSKLKTLPHSPGVYFHKDKSGEIIYIGKAAVLKNRVKQYFQDTKYIDTKTKALINEIADTDWVETDSEIDALFLEAEMIKRYLPRYNILLRDDKSLTYVRIDMKSEWPYVSYTRNPADDGAQYFGPYYNSFAVKKALRHLRRIFPYYDTKPSTTRSVPEGHEGNDRKSLDAHLGLSPSNMTSKEYKSGLRKLISYIDGDRKKIFSILEKDMKAAAKTQNFESAALLRNKLSNLRELQRKIVFGDKEFLDISKDEALSGLASMLGIKKALVRVEGFDVSHISGTNVVASMVVFKNGVSARGEYRKFKIKVEQNDDYSSMAEVISRRFSEKNIKNWGTPNLVLIDGGKGQLGAALAVRDSLGCRKIPFIGLAERGEQIVIKDISIDKVAVSGFGGIIEKTDEFTVIDLPNSTHIIKLLQRIRDESHRFAVSYHTVLKRQKQTLGLLDGIPGIGPKTRSKLIRKFGSLRAIKDLSELEIADVIGSDKAKKVKVYLG